MKTNLLKINLLLVFLMLQSILWSQNLGKTNFLRAENLRKSKYFKEAILEYDKAIDLESTHYLYHYNKALALKGLNPKEYDEIIKELKSSVYLKKDFVKGYITLAKIYMLKNDTVNTFLNYNLAIDYEIENYKKVKIVNQLVNLQIKYKKYDLAQQNLQTALVYAPFDPSVLYLQGKIHSLKKEWKEALSSYLLIFEKNVCDPKIAVKYYFSMGEAYYKLGQKDKAEDAWKNCQFEVYKKKILKIKGIKSK